MTAVAYTYETHLHTSQASACSQVRARDYVPRYIQAGYQGIIVTDHFFRGNTSISPTLSWKEKVKQFTKGYEEAKEVGLQKGLDVFFGWEENYFGTEFLIYGLSPQWLMEHPEAARWTIAQQFEAVSAAGGCVIQAHPFRDRFYISEIRLDPHLVHGVEAFNGGNAPHEDARAKAYANYYKLPTIAGTDIHKTAHWQPKELMGVTFEKPLVSIDDFVRRIRSKVPLPLRLDKARQVLDHLECPPLEPPIVYYDRGERAFPSPL